MLTVGQGTPRTHDNSPVPPPGLVNCEYPTPKRVREICSELDTRGLDSYETAIQRLRRDGSIKWACRKEGVDYRVYPAELPDPPGAELVKCGDEEYEPNTEAKITAEVKV